MQKQWSKELKQDIDRRCSEITKTRGEASFPTQSDNFKRIVSQKTIFVDKTLFIKKIIDMNNQVMLITRPRRWGKTTNLDMLYTFFNLEVNGQGIPLDPPPNLKFFAGGELMQQTGTKFRRRSKKLTPLNISKEVNRGKSYLDFQGKFPVIFLCWKDIKADNIQTVQKSLCESILDEYLKHPYLAKYPQYSRWMNRFKNILDGQKGSISLKDSVLDLSQLLEQHHKRKVMILIDEYDAPYNYMLQYKMDIEERKQVAWLLTNLMDQAFKGNNSLYKGIFTGVLYTVQNGFGSGFNNFRTYDILNQKFSSFYGFTSQEIEEMARKMFNIRNKDDQIVIQYLLHKIQKCYKGYILPETKKKLYNPYAVINYLSGCVKDKKIIKPQPYWVKTGTDQLLKLFFTSYKQDIGNVLELDVSIPTSLDCFERVEPNDLDFQNLNKDSITNILVHTGYLTGHIRGTSLYALVPNHQILQNFKDVFIDWAQQTKFIADRSCINLEDPIQLKTKMMKTWKQVKGSIRSKNWIVFNSLFGVRYLLSEQRTHKVSVEEYCGAGFTGNVFYPFEHQQSHTIIIHQYKYTEQPDKFEDLYNSALWQIFQKEYLCNSLSLAKVQTIQSIIVRPIVIVQQSDKNIKFHIQDQDIRYSIEEAQQIYKYFGKEQTRQSLGLTINNRKIKQCRNNLLKKQKSNNIGKLLQKIIKNIKKREHSKEEQKIPKRQKSLKRRKSSKKGKSLNKEKSTSKGKSLDKGKKVLQERPRSIQVGSNHFEQSLRTKISFSPKRLEYAKEEKSIDIHKQKLELDQPLCEKLQSSIKKMSLGDSLGLEPTDFDYNKAIANLPHIKNPRKRPYLFEKPNSNNEFDTDSKNVSSNFKKHFPNGQSLYNASEKEIRQVEGSDAGIAQDVFKALQKMKRDPQFYKSKAQKKEQGGNEECYGAKSK